MGILIGSAVIPIILCMFWEKLTGPGMIAGGICGTVAALIAWLLVSSLYSGGLYDFIKNTGMYFNIIAVLFHNFITKFNI